LTADPRRMASFPCGIDATRRGPGKGRAVRICEDVFLHTDTCHVSVLRHPDRRQAVLVDFGSGDVLDRLGDFGVDEITDVLVTHHHRDQVQGLARAVATGAASGASGGVGCVWGRGVTNAVQFTFTVRVRSTTVPRCRFSPQQRTAAHRPVGGTYEFAGKRLDAA
jgi:hypothetical protein